MICGDDYSRQSSLKSRPPSFPFLHLKLLNNTQLWNFTTLCNRQLKGNSRTVALLIGAATHFLSRNLSEVQRSVTGQKGFVFFCLFLLGGTEREMSKNLGRRGIRQSSGANVLKKKNPLQRQALGGHEASRLLYSNVLIKNGV